MNWLNNLSVRAKLIAVIAMMVFGFASIAVVFTFSIIHEKEAIATVEHMGDVSYKTLKVSELMLQARRAEKDFLLRDDLKYDQRHDGHMEAIYETLDEIQDDMTEEAARGSFSDVDANNIDTLRELFQNYQTTYKDMVQAKIYLGLDESSGTEGAFRKNVHAVEKLINEANDPVLLSTMLMMRRHEKDFIMREHEKYIPRMAKRQEEFAQQLRASKVPPQTQTEMTARMAEYHQGFLDLVAGTKLVRERIATYREAVHQVDPILEATTKRVEQILGQTKLDIDQQVQNFAYTIAIVIALTGLLILATLIFVNRSLNLSLGRLNGTVTALNDGDYNARVGLENDDELGQLGRAFDSMLDERLANLAQAEQENNRLNDSIIEIMEAVSELADRNLTVRVPVAENVTGPVADAMNLMTGQTASVLNDIRGVAFQVADSSRRVQEQGGRVIELAHNERTIVDETMKSLTEASKSMNQVAKLANACNETAAKASDSTQQALETVSQTASGMNEIRETIAETEKRIKRLGERSQEINGVVEIINNIAERTHVLALNASMQAAAAGEAGRGFAVVADEVQRLAESSRQSTSEIAALVSNIQAETAETMSTMNKTITQVVEGSELAQSAGSQMQQTQKTTSELAHAVEQISKRSLMQAQVSNNLMDEAAKILKSTQDTNSELEQQSKQSEQLAEYSQALVESVAVFKLPKSERDQLREAS
ncbi:MAG: methyl-accepting chemotaxis protein [Gammaproteobacteria bacterium]|nr:methyl-accepting chemotaxis protein [Gammaproteobacteria bacterium]